MTIIRLVIFFLFIIEIAYSQNLEKPEDVKLKLLGNGAIFQQGNVKGYYFYYEADKKDKKTNNYILRVLDEDAKDVNNINFSKPLTYKLVESSYNGSCFLFLFFDSKQNKVSLLTFDNALKQIGEYEKNVSDPDELRSYKGVLVAFLRDEKRLAPITDKGFIIYGKGSIEAFSNSLQPMWSQRTVGTPFDGFYTDSLAGYAINRLVEEAKIEYYLLVNNPKTGKYVCSFEIKSPVYKIVPYHFSYDSATQRISAFGEYFEKNDDPMTNTSLGFCYMIYDLKGTNVGSKLIPRSTMLGKPLVNYNGNTEELQKHVLFHDFIRTKDGQVFVVGEEYKRTTNAGRILMARYMAPAVMNVYNLVIYQFNASKELDKIHVFHKNKTKVEISGLFMSVQAVARHVKRIGGFDYRYSQEFPGNETFSVIYKDIDKKKGEEVLGTIVYAPEKVFQNDKIVFKRESVRFAVLPAKPGYVLVAEYLTKEKKVDMRLEKINY